MMSKTSFRAIIPAAMLLLIATVCNASEVPAALADASDFTFIEYTGCSDGSYNRIFVDFASDCAELCRNDQQCGAFTVNAGNLRCYLKESCNRKEPKTDNFSGVKRTELWLDVTTPEETSADDLTVVEEYEYDEPQEEEYYEPEVEEDEPVAGEAKDPTYTVLISLGCSDDSYWRDGGMDEPSCQEACTADPRCGAYTVNIVMFRCYLKDTCDTARRKTDNISGIKSGTPLPSTVIESSPPPPSPLPSPPAPPLPQPPPPLVKTKDSVFYAYPAYYCNGKTIISNTAGTARICRKRCENNNDCMAYSYHVVKKTCELKGICKKLVPNAPWITGFLLPNPDSWYP